MQGSQPIRVLLVDDEERFLTTTASILRKRGFSVAGAADGSAAVEAVQKDSFDVMVLDLKMPGMDGVQTLHEVRRIRPDQQVILLTAHGSYEAALSGLQDGIFDYLSKPCDIDLLACKIQEACKGRRALSGDERRVRDIMVPLHEFSTIRHDRTVAEAIETVARSFARAMVTSSLHETVHRSILVLDQRGKVLGVLSFHDVLRGLQPPELRGGSGAEPMPEQAEAREPPSHGGMFTIMVQEMLRLPVRALMSDVPPLIQSNADLMEAAHRLLRLRVPRLLAVEEDQPVGVVREQDLFFEIVSILRQQR
ncbi:MAG: response regulator [bacterium]